MLDLKLEGMTRGSVYLQPIINLLSCNNYVTNSTQSCCLVSQSRSDAVNIIEFTIIWIFNLGFQKERGRRFVGTWVLDCVEMEIDRCSLESVDSGMSGYKNVSSLGTSDISIVDC